MPPERRQEVAVLVGLQASGKSTFYRRRLAATHDHVSKDNWPNARHRQRRQLRVIAETLAQGRDVAVDNTNPSPEEWNPIVVVAREHGARVVAYWFPPDLAASLRRNALRPGRAQVPEIGILATARRLSRPRLPHGFDAIHVVTMDGRGGFTVRQDVTDGDAPAGGPVIPRGAAPPA